MFSGCAISVTLENQTLMKNRTDQQNRALHLYFNLLADELNAGGYTVQLVLKEKIDLDWDAGKVKELLWRPAQQAILGVKSTTELSKHEDIDKVYDHLTRHIGEKFGLTVEFPNAPDGTLTKDGKIIIKNT